MNITEVADKYLEILSKAPEACRDCEDRHFKGCYGCHHYDELQKSFNKPVIHERSCYIECVDGSWSMTDLTHKRIKDENEHLYRKTKSTAIKYAKLIGYKVLNEKEN